MWTVLNEIGPEFERSSGYKLIVVTDIAATLADRIIAGESFDVFIGPPVQIDRVIKSNKIVAETRTAIAHSGIGVEVRAGAHKPDISSVEAFKQTLLNAKSIGDPSKKGRAARICMDCLTDLGLLRVSSPKVVRPDTDIVSELVAKGEIEIGLVVATQIMTTRGVEVGRPDSPRNPVLCQMERRCECELCCTASREGVD